MSAPDPLIFGVRLSALHGLYLQRLRYHAVAEFLAGAGIAVGVALVFGVLVANSGILGSAREVIRDVNGAASVKLAARSPDGFDQRIAERASRLPGVARSAFALRANAIVQGPSGSRLGQLVGLTPDVVGLKPAGAKSFGVTALLLSGGIGLPAELADSIGIQPEGTVSLRVRGRLERAPVTAVFDARVGGALASGRVVVGVLRRVQAIVGRPRRVSEVLIEPRPGQAARVARELRTLAAGRLDVVPADNELALAGSAAKPTDQSTALFAAISVMVGFLLALNAMLLTVPERRRTVAEMRIQGYDARQILTILGYQATVLGLGASLVGVFGGDLLAHTLFNRVPTYLASAFPITGRQQIGAVSVLAALACGVLASLLASVSPIADLRPGRPVDAVLRDTGEPGQGIGANTVRRAALAGLSLTALATLAALADARLTIPAGVVLALALLCLLPSLFDAITGALRHFARRVHGGMVAVAVIELRATATRSVALAGIAALAIFGSIAVGGAREDLIHGLDQGIAQQWDTTSLWVTPNENIHDVDSFPARPTVAAIARLAAVRSVSVHQGSFLDVGSHRLWIRATPPSGESAVLSSQLRSGGLARADSLMRRRGWATVSSGFAAERSLRVGGAFVLPTPSGPVRLHVAAVTTNIGWPPGTITLNTRDYSRYWQDADPTTLAIRLRSGVDPFRGRRLVAQALPAGSGLRVQTAAQRILEVKRIARQGLSILADISRLLLLVSALSLAAALSTAVYQRRARLASLKAHGFDRLQLWRGVLLESVVVVGIGAFSGAVLGLCGHALADRYLRGVAGFPAPFGWGGGQLALTLLIVVAVSLVVIALPGYSATGVPAQASFQE